MTAFQYYEDLKKLARDQRAFFGLKSSRMTITQMRKIYQYHGVSFDLWPFPGIERPPLKSLRGAYLSLDEGPCVFVSRKLPAPQRIFTMAHELKHHLVDKDTVDSFCYEENVPALIEKGAEVFAAELIYPEADFAKDLKSRGIKIGECTAEDIVHLKHQNETTLSYTSLAKRAEFLGFAPPKSLPTTGWLKLEESLYGIPFYRRIYKDRRSVSF